MGYYNYRSYNPTDGRWTRKDSIGIRGGNNLYQYCRNLVSLYLDVLGKMYVEDMNFVSNKCCSPNRDCSRECQGKERFRKVKNGCCEYRANEQDKTHEPKANGCGAEGGISFPDNYKLIAPEFSFKMHVMLMTYAMENVSRTRINATWIFLNNLKSSCLKAMRGYGDSLIMLPECDILARVCYLGVWTLAACAYQQAQDQACKWRQC